jgi:hypothetical protein
MFLNAKTLTAKRKAGHYTGFSYSPQELQDDLLTV